LKPIEDVVKGVLEGRKRAIARAISIIEDSGPGAADLLNTLEPYGGRAYVIGVTGATGSGKSTLIHKLAMAYRKRGHRVGIIAIDPTSPFTGGAFLGDRIRMQDLTLDEGIFIRSMATRESVGGISNAAEGAVRVLDAAGFDTIIVETVGAGQLDVGIAGLAHTVLLVLAPGLGDEIQAIKAGLMEIADIFVVNKADKPEADRTVADLMSVLEMEDYGSSGWRPPIVKTVALTGEGVEELVRRIEEHKEFMRSRGLRFSEKKVRVMLVEALRRAILSDVLPMITMSAKFEGAVRMVMSGKLTVSSGAELLLAPLKEFLRCRHEEA